MQIIAIEVLEPFSIFRILRIFFVIVYLMNKRDQRDFHRPTYHFSIASVDIVRVTPLSRLNHVDARDPFKVYWI